jgi:CRISPR/Cas system-associated exonuclease Cas4 (RecB family)
MGKRTMAVDIKEVLIKALHDRENNRPRSTQVQIGPSELGGCRRKVWYRLNNQPETNDAELKLAAIMGTAIHSAIESALAGNNSIVLEQTVEYNGMKAHVDAFISDTGDVIDWKTVKAKNLSYFPSQQQRWQVQVYGYLIDKSGKGKPRTVNLVAIPRDGDERDIKVHSEPYDEKIALEALDWLAAIKDSADAPAPERDESYCKFYCKYYDASGEMGCVGLKKERIKADMPVIEDEAVSMTALEYVQLDEKIKSLEVQKEALRENLSGITGVTTTGYEIKWSTIQSNTVDKEAVEKALGFVPTKQGKESARLSIKPTGGK